jgi:hypothetical protein
MFTVGTVRYPRAWLVVAGSPWPCVEASASVHRYQSADTFSAQLAMDAAPVSIAQLSSMDPIPAALIGDNGDGNSKELVKGTLDSVNAHFDTRVVLVSGRDRTAEFLDTQTKEKFQDKTASQIVEEIAGRHGIAVQTDATQLKAGKQYVYQHDQITDLESEWSLILYLAEREGKVAFVKGDTLYFVAPGNTDASGGSFNVWYSPPSPSGPAAGNMISIMCGRNLTLAKGVKVNVRAFDRRQKKVITGTKSKGGGGLEFNYSIPGISKEEADAIADKKATENARHQMSIHYVGPGDVNADPRMMLSLSGTGTAWDQKYFIDAIDHRFTPESGYQMTIDGKNEEGGGS